MKYLIMLAFISLEEFLRYREKQNSGEWGNQIIKKDIFDKKERPALIQNINKGEYFLSEDQRRVYTKFPNVKIL